MLGSNWLKQTEYLFDASKNFKFLIPKSILTFDPKDQIDEEAKAFEKQRQRDFDDFANTDFAAPIRNFRPQSRFTDYSYGDVIEKKRPVTK